MPMWNWGRTYATAGGVTPTFTAGTSQVVHTAFSNPNTFTGVQGGSYPSAGLAVIAIVQDQLWTPPPTWSMTVGGNTATYISGANEGSSVTTLWYAAVNSGDADTVVFTQGVQTSGYIGVAGAFLTGMTAAPTASTKLTYGSDNGGVSPTPISIPTNGFGLIVYGSVNPTATGTGEAITFTGTTSSSGDSSAISATHLQIAFAHQVGAVSNWSPTVTGSPNSINFAYALSAAAWGP